MDYDNIFSARYDAIEIAKNVIKANFELEIRHSLGRDFLEKHPPSIQWMASEENVIHLEGVCACISFGPKGRYYCDVFRIYDPENIQFQWKWKISYYQHRNSKSPVYLECGYEELQSTLNQLFGELTERYAEEE